MLKRTLYTITPSLKEIKRSVVYFDAKGAKLGRLATTIATKLVGKHKVNYVANLDMGDFVVVTNATALNISEKKLGSKMYKSYSGYQSGQKITLMSALFAKDPAAPLVAAVKGMLPDNKLKTGRLKRLFVFAHEAKNLPKEVQQLIKK